MPRRKSRHQPKGTLPPMLARLIHAARHAAEVDRSTARHGEAELLEELGHLALVTVAACGALAPIDDSLSTAIGNAAERHLRAKHARRQWHEALEVLMSAEERDTLEGAHLWVLSEANKAYFYAGVAFAVTLACPPTP